MSERWSEGSAKSGSVGSSRGSIWRKRRQKRHEDKEHEHGKKRSGLGEGSYQTNWAASNASGHRQLDERDEELERLRRLVRDLELEARDRPRRGDQDNLAGGFMSRGDCYGHGSEQSGSHRHRDRSCSRESRRLAFTRVPPTSGTFTIMGV